MLGSKEKTWERYVKTSMYADIGKAKEKQKAEEGTAPKRKRQTLGDSSILALPAWMGRSERGTTQSGFVGGRGWSLSRVGSLVILPTCCNLD